MNALPDGIDRVVSVDVLDTGVVSFELIYDAGEGLSAFGTVPENFDAPAMAEALDLKVLVEGVENADQRDLARKEGCQSYQGFLRAEPMSAPDFLKLAGS